MSKKSVTETMIDILTVTPGLKRRDVYAAVLTSIPNATAQYITNAFIRYRIGGKLPPERTFFHRSVSGLWYVDVEKAQSWLSPSKREKRNPSIEMTKRKIERRYVSSLSESHCFDLDDAANRAKVSVRDIVKAINSGALIADFVDDPVATYVIANADIDRAFP